MKKNNKLTDAAIYEILEQCLSQFSHLPNVVITESVNILPAEALEEKPTGLVKNDIIYLFSDNLQDELEVKKTVFHELFHYGIRKVMNKEDYIDTMLSLYSKDAFIKYHANLYASNAKNISFLNDRDYALARGVEEQLAILAESDLGLNKPTTLLSFTVRNVATWLSNVAFKFGFKEESIRLMGVSNQEARNVIQKIFEDIKTDKINKKEDEFCYSKDGLLATF